MERRLKEPAARKEKIDPFKGTFKQTGELVEYTWTIPDVPKNEIILTQQQFNPDLCEEKTNWAMFLKHSPKANIPITVTLVNHGISKYKVTPTVKLTFELRSKKIYGVHEKTEHKTYIVGDWEVYEFMFKREETVITNFNHLIRSIEYKLKIDVTLAIDVETKNPLDKGIESRVGPFLEFSRALDQMGEHANFEILTKDATFFVQREMLTLRSEYFFSLFKLSKPKNFEIKDMEGDVVYEMLRYLYTGKVKHVEKHIYNLLELAHRYKIYSLKVLCETTLLRQFSKHNLGNINKVIVAVEKYELMNLKQRIIDLILESLTKDFRQQATPEMIKASVMSIYNAMANSKNQ